MSYAQALIAGSLAPSYADLAVGLNNRHAPRDGTNGFYSDTAHRRTMDALLTGAALAGCEVSLGFIKADGTLRYMRCVPVPGADCTRQYMTVKDLELTATRGRETFRRVCLDTIVACSVEYKASTGN